MSNNQFDIPAIAQSVDPAIRNPMTRMREELQKLIGTRGTGLDAAITQRNAVTVLGSTTGFSSIAGTSTTTTPTVDLTPPPSVTNLSITAGLANVFINWDAATYTQGRGHGQTNLYAAKKASTDVTLPTFTDAVRVYSATGALTLAALPSDLSIRWHVWAKWQSADGVESTAPAGGINGVVAQTGKIGNADLGPLIVQAGNIASGAVTATSFASGTNPVFFGTALPTLPNATYPAGSIFILTTTNKLFRVVTAGTSWTSASDGADIVAGTIVAGQVAAGGLSANTIAVGSAAIQNGAIVNAMIGTAAIDDAKIANLSATKVTFGTMSGDRITANTLNASAITANTITATQIAAGSVTADRIDSRGLSIKDGAGTVILASGTALNAFYAAAGTLNSAVSIGANGVLSGAGGGTVSIAGLDGTVVRSANPITSGNITTYISGAAIQTAQIANLAVGTAQIANAAVDSLQVAGNAITAPGASSLVSDTALISLTPVTMCSVTINPASSPVYISATVSIKANSAIGAANCYARILKDGTIVASGFQNVNGFVTNQRLLFPLSYFDPTNTAGNHTYTLQIFDDASQLSALSGTTNLFCLGVKR